MGGLLTFRVGNFDTTAEREQFRFLCEQLKAHYEDSNEFCVFAGNYNIGCELDALFIKKGRYYFYRIQKFMEVMLLPMKMENGHTMVKLLREVRERLFFNKLG